MKNTAPRSRRFLRLFLLLYPFVTAAVAVNLFMLGLAGAFLGLPSPAPLTVLWVAVPIGFPASLVTTRWMQSLIAQAEG